jgi:hypothetical protein
MANTSKINGFTPVKHLNGSPYNGGTNIYYVASASDEMFVGDVVKLAGSADADGIATVNLAAASDVPVGIIVAVLHSKYDPRGKLTTGSTALDTSATAPAIAASGAAYVLVADSPDLVMEVEAGNGTPAVADIGLNASHANGTRGTTTSVCPAYIDMGTEAATSTLNFRLLGFSQKVGNEVGASAKMLVGFNVHQYGSVGTTGL